MECIFCKRIINNKGSALAHQNVCKLNPERKKYTRSPFAGRKKGCVAWNKGKSNVEIYGEFKAAQIKQKASSSIQHLVNTTGSSWSKMSIDQQNQFKENHRQAINNRYENGWLPKAGRCEKIKYFSIFAGDTTVDGTWEYELAVYLDENKINWKRNKKRFSYINEHNKQSFYTPDFYIVDFNFYIEIKGYETEKDRCKWKHFTEELVILKAEELKLIKQKVPFKDIIYKSKHINKHNQEVARLVEDTHLK
jgi:hypothetical protein